MEEETVANHFEKVDENRKIVIGLVLLIVLVLSIILSFLVIQSNKPLPELSDSDSIDLISKAGENTNNYKGLIRAEGNTNGFRFLIEVDSINGVTHTIFSEVETYDDSVTTYSTFDGGETWYSGPSPEANYLDEILSPNQDSTFEDSYAYIGTASCYSSNDECHRYNNSATEDEHAILVNPKNKRLDSFVTNEDQFIGFTYFDNKSLEIPGEIIEKAVDESTILEQ
jgi:hypothetical protein